MIHPVTTPKVDNSLGAHRDTDSHTHADILGRLQGHMFSRYIYTIYRILKSNLHAAYAIPFLDKIVNMQVGQVLHCKEPIWKVSDSNYYNKIFTAEFETGTLCWTKSAINL